MKLTKTNIKYINDFFARNNFHETADATYSIDKESDVVIIEIHWGDWKHEHLRANWLMGELGFVCYREDELETDGSDCHSSIHYYYRP